MSDAVGFMDDLDRLNDLEDQIFDRLNTGAARLMLWDSPIYDQMCAWFGDPT